MLKYVKTLTHIHFHNNMNWTHSRTLIQLIESFSEIALLKGIWYRSFRQLQCKSPVANVPLLYMLVGTWTTLRLRLTERLLKWSLGCKINSPPSSTLFPTSSTSLINTALKYSYWRQKEREKLMRIRYTIYQCVLIVSLRIMDLDVNIFYMLNCGITR